MYSLPGFKSNSRGRFQAGLSLLVSQQSKFKVLELPSCNPLAHAFRFSHSFVFIVVNVYLPPSPDKASLCLLWEHLTTYLQHLEHLFPTTDIILLGDFNARIGKDDWDLLEALNLDPNVPLPWFFRSGRISKDAQINQAGIQFTKFCI